MKKLVVVLGLALAAFSFQTSAATVTLVNGFGTFEANHAGAFLDTWTFSAPSNTGIGASATNAFVRLTGKISNFSATLDGNSLFRTTGMTSQLLEILLPSSAASSHTLLISGSSAGSYAGSIAVAQTPIPAAIWLFGSALMGLTGISRRKVAKA